MTGLMGVRGRGVIPPQQVVRMTIEYGYGAVRREAHQRRIRPPFESSYPTKAKTNNTISGPTALRPIFE
jgi:hypothetical protein